MTRDKEIQKAAKEIAQDIEDWEIAEDVQDAFEAGAQWADEHPKQIEVSLEDIEELAKEVIPDDWVKQQDTLWEMIRRNQRAQFIDKACKWLALQAQYVNIDAFRKAMESSCSEKPNNSEHSNNSKKQWSNARQDELNEAWCNYANKCSTEIMQALAFALRWCDEHPNWETKELLTRKDVCKLFSISEMTLFRWARDKRLPQIKIGGSVRYRKSDVYKMLEKGEEL